MWERYQRLFGIPDIWRPPSLVTPSANLEQKLNFQHMRHHKSARAEMGYKSTPTCEIMRIGIRVNTPPNHFFDHHCKILYEGALWFRTWDQQSFWKQLLLSSVLSQSGFSPLVPLLCNMCWRRHCTKMTVQISIVSLFIFFLLLQIFSANMENPASWHCEPHVVQI